jgi:hypothetical protein
MCHSVNHFPHVRGQQILMNAAKKFSAPSPIRTSKMIRWGGGKLRPDDESLKHILA